MGSRQTPTTKYKKKETIPPPFQPNPPPPPPPEKKEKEKGNAPKNLSPKSAFSKIFKEGDFFFGCVVLARRTVCVAVCIGLPYRVQSGSCILLI